MNLWVEYIQGSAEPEESICSGDWHTRTNARTHKHIRMFVCMHALMYRALPSRTHARKHHLMCIHKLTYNSQKSIQICMYARTCTITH